MYKFSFHLGSLQVDLSSEMVLACTYCKSVCRLHHDKEQRVERQLSLAPSKCEHLAVSCSNSIPTVSL